MVFAVWLGALASPTEDVELGPGALRVDTRGCPGFDAVTLTSALEVELAAEPDARAGTGVAVIECDADVVRIEVESSRGYRTRTIAGPDRAALTERSLALAIAPLFVPQREPAPVVSADDDGQPARADAQAEDPTRTEAVPPDDAMQPDPVAPQTARGLEAPASGFDAPRGLAAVIRPFAVIHDASGVGGQLGVLGWLSSRVGLGVVATSRWGRARRDRGQVDALVAGGGPVLAVRLGPGRLKFRGDLGAAVAYARLAGTSNRSQTVGRATGRLAFDAMLALGAQVSWPRLVLAPQIVVGTTPRAPLGIVTDERAVSLLVPYGGLALSIEPWLHR